MKFLRRMLAWFLFWLGAIALSFWVSASFLTHKVDSGSIASPVISSVLHQQRIQDLIVDQAQSLITEELAQNGVPITGTPQEQVLNNAIVNAIASEGFIDDLTEVIAELESSIISQLTDDSLPLAPLVITFDVTEPLYAALAESPEIAALVPATTLEPITIDPLDADEVANVRGWYDWVQFASQWGMWIGLGLLVLGFIVLPGKRWIIPKILLGLGITTLIGWFLASKLTTEWILDRLGEEAAPEFRESVAELIPQARIDDIQSDLLKYAIILFVLSAIAYTLVFFLFRKRKPRTKAEPEPEPEPEFESELEPMVARNAAAETAVAGPGGTIPPSPAGDAVPVIPPPVGMQPQGARPSGNQSARSERDDPVYSGEATIGEGPTDSEQRTEDHPEPGSPSRKPGNPAGPSA